MAIQRRQSAPEPWPEGTPPDPGYQGRWGERIGGMAAPSIAKAVEGSTLLAAQKAAAGAGAAGAASAGVAGSVQASLGGVPGVVAGATLGPWGILGIAVGATLIGATLDWLFGKATSKPAKPPPPPTPAPQHRQLGGGLPPPTPRTPVDYASMDPGRTEFRAPALEPVRRAAADSMLAKRGGQAFGQKRPEVGAFGTPRFGSRRA